MEFLEQVLNFTRTLDSCARSCWRMVGDEDLVLGVSSSERIKDLEECNCVAISSL